jgi:hypothetical protein
VTENTVLDLPTAVVSVYMDTNDPRTPGKNELLLVLNYTATAW